MALTMAHYVFCDDDEEGWIVLATRRSFATADEAHRYAATVAPSRRPFVAERGPRAVAFFDVLNADPAERPTPKES